MATEQDLIRELAASLEPMGFESRPVPGPVQTDIVWPALWVRKTWNTNRAVALLMLPEGEGETDNAGSLAQETKFEIGRVAGYFPILYGLGLQTVWAGHSVGARANDLDRHVDKIDNQRTIVQSIHVADLGTSTRISARTWGQVVTGKYQDAIEEAIDRALQPPTRRSP